MPQAMGSLLGLLLGHVWRLPPGEYLLTHAARAGQVGCWRVAAGPQAAGQVRTGFSASALSKHWLAKCPAGAHEAPAAWGVPTHACSA